MRGPASDTLFAAMVHTIYLLQVAFFRRTLRMLGEPRSEVTLKQACRPLCSPELELLLLAETLVQQAGSQIW